MGFLGRVSATMTAVLMVLAFTSCSSNKPVVHHYADSTFYEVDSPSPEFNQATPVQFHKLKKGMTPEDVLQAVGEPDSKEIDGPSFGHLWTWQLKAKLAEWPKGPGHEFKHGSVIVIFNSEMKVTQIEYVEFQGAVLY